MRSKRERGATMALVASLCLVLVIIGFAFFWIARMLGGGQELQRTTDSGNLNVAKEALRSPKLSVFGAGPYDIGNAAFLSEIQKNFGDLQDPANGQLDLLVYNRLVGQSLLVAVNAADENTPVADPAAIANAQKVIQLLIDPNNGVGPNLTKKLTSDSALDQNFTNLASLGNLRMFDAGTSAVDLSTVKDISYMLPPSGGNAYAGNVYFSLNSVPASQQTNFLSTYTVQKTFTAPDPNPGTYNYVAGYEALNVPGVTTAGNTLMGVPLRPHQNPHIVDGTDFDTSKTSPLPVGGGVAPSAVPPNAFKAGGTGLDGRSLQLAAAVSCAIAGAITGTADYPASIPCGVIAVANGYGTDPTQTTGSTGPIAFAGNTVFPSVALPGAYQPDIFSGILMTGVYVSATSTATAVATNLGCIGAIENQLYLNQTNGQPNTTGLAPLIGCLYGTTQMADALSLPSIQSPGNDSVYCMDSTVSGPDQIPACVADLASGLFYTKLGAAPPSGNTSTTLYGPVSAVEYVKSEAIDARSSGGPVNANFGSLAPPNNSGIAYSGMNAFPLQNYEDIGYRNTAPPFKTTPIQPPSLNAFIGPTGNFTIDPNTAAVANKAYATVVERMYEMKPTLKTTDADFTTVLNTALPQGTAMYIWLDTTATPPTFKISDAGTYNGSGLPYKVDLTQLQADGQTQTGTEGPAYIVGDLADLDDENGYPHPWDCPPGGGTSSEVVQWTPSTGKDCLLGIMRFYNAVNLGGTGAYTFDCPC
jgi:hypothetical protein